MNILKTSIVIPTYKENDNIKIIIPLIYNYLSNKKFIFEVIIIDDNSNDGIINTVKNLKKKFENLRIFVRRNKIRDLSLSCFLGFKLSKYNNILVMDADLQHNPKYLKLLIKRFSLEKIDVLVACRNFKKKSEIQLSLLRFFLSKIIIIIFNCALGFKTSDPMSGFFIFKKSLYLKNKLKFFGKGYKILVDILYNSEDKLKVKDQYIKFDRRYMNKSKMNLKILFLIIILLIKTYVKRLFLIHKDVQ